jgi:hypothetical protein
MKLRYQENSNVQHFTFLMKFFRTAHLQHNFYELVKLHLWGWCDVSGMYHSFNLLHDKDFLYFQINLNNTNQYSFSFFDSIREFEKTISPGLKEKFRKDTVEVESSMFLWRPATVDSV